jgi:hypothetical protein
MEETLTILKDYEPVTAISIGCLGNPQLCPMLCLRSIKKEAEPLGILSQAPAWELV